MISSWKHISMSTELSHEQNVFDQHTSIRWWMHLSKIELEASSAAPSTNSSSLSTLASSSSLLLARRMMWQMRTQTDPSRLNPEATKSNRWWPWRSWRQSACQLPSSSIDHDGVLWVHLHGLQISATWTRLVGSSWTPMVTHLLVELVVTVLLRWKWTSRWRSFRRTWCQRACQWTWSRHFHHHIIVELFPHQPLTSWAQRDYWGIVGTELHVVGDIDVPDVLQAANG